MTIRLIQLAVFATICFIAFAQENTLGEVADSVVDSAPQVQQHAVPIDSLGLLAEMR